MSNSLEPTKGDSRFKAIWQQFGGCLAHVGPLPEKNLVGILFAIYCARKTASLGKEYSGIDRLFENDPKLPGFLDPAFIEDQKCAFLGTLKTEAENLETSISQYEPLIADMLATIAGCRKNPFSLGKQYWQANQPTAHWTAIVLARRIIHVLKRGSKGDPREIPVLACEDLSTLENAIVWEARAFAANLALAREGLHSGRVDGTAPAQEADSRTGNETGAKSAVKPAKYLASWREILDCLDLENNDEKRRLVAEMNRQYDGPILPAPRGGQPKAEKTKLLAWWNGLEAKWVTQRGGQNSKASVEETYLHGQNATVVPEIGGHVKPRRNSKK